MVIEEEIPTESRVSLILENIRNGNIKTITDLIQYAIENKGLKQIKQMQFLLTKSIEEHKNVNLKGR